MEIWREIKGYESIYEVSNLGRIRSLDRYVRHSKGGLKIVRGSIRKLPQPHPKTGYVLVSLYKNGKPWTVSVHRLVAFAFPEICGEYFDNAVVDHLDTIRHNNCANNLKWCTCSENHLNPITYEREKVNRQIFIESRRGKPAWNKNKKMPTVTGEKHWNSKKVKQFDKNGELITVWVNAYTAAKKLNIRSTSIYNCLTNRSMTAGGFVWKYV